MAEYVIAQVSQKEPKRWRTKTNKDMLSYKIKLQGIEEPVDYSRFHLSPEPMTGDIIQGELKQDDFGYKLYEDYGKKLPASKPSQSYTRDDSAIQAQWSIGQAIAWVTSDKADVTTGYADIEAIANDFFAMIQRVKQGQPADKPNTKPDTVRDTRKALGIKAIPNEPDLEYEDKPIDLSEIPF